MTPRLIGFIAPEELLGLFFGGVVGVALQFHLGGQLLYDSAADPACFRIPGYVIAAFERPGHLFLCYRAGDACGQAMVRRKALSTVLSTS
jgi:hypothetical protein